MAHLDTPLHTYYTYTRRTSVGSTRWASGALDNPRGSTADVPSSKFLPPLALGQHLVGRNIDHWIAIQLDLGLFTAARDVQGSMLSERRSSKQIGQTDATCNLTHYNASHSSDG